jgi:hypothetical protein
MGLVLLCSNARTTQSGQSRLSYGAKTSARRSTEGCANLCGEVLHLPSFCHNRCVLSSKRWKKHATIHEHVCKMCYVTLQTFIITYKECLFAIQINSVMHMDFLWGQMLWRLLHSCIVDESILKICPVQVIVLFQL